MKFCFLGYIVSADGIKVDPTKVESNMSWPVPKNLTKVRVFHGLTSFYRLFMKNLCSIMEPITASMKQGVF